MSTPDPRIQAREITANGSSGGFTLIELLVVTVIIALLFFVALPAFQTMGKKDINSASMEMVSTLRLARQHAITHRQPVWIVFPDLRASYASQPQEVAKALSSYAVVSTNPVAKTYEYITEWKHLPEGVYFDSDYPGAEAPVFKSFAAGKTDFPFPNENSAVVRNLSAFMFKPNGSVYHISEGDWMMAEVKIPITSRRYYDVDLTLGNKVRAELDPPGTSVVIRLKRKTGMIDYNDE